MSVSQKRIWFVRIVQGMLLVMLLWLLVVHLVGFHFAPRTQSNISWLLPLRARIMKVDVGWRNVIQRNIHTLMMEPLARQGAYDRALQVCASTARLDLPGTSGAGRYYCIHLSEEKAMYEYCQMNCGESYCQQLFEDLCR